ncbi:MAG: hypothetical protein PHY16_03330 [Methylobacter sp.]|nr:hypothetical protein [Methylobacter sp.]
MALPNISATHDFGGGRPLPNIESEPIQASSSAVAWSAILAGAAAAAALSLILLILGTGLGLSSVSPWTYQGVSATTFGVSTILWLTFTQIVASGVGGYLAGRLRTKWAALHSDEVYFRDTAHGFLAWAIASLATAALLTSVIGSVVNSGVQAGASMVEGVGTATGGAAVTGSEMAKSGKGNESMGYFVDSLFRPASSGNTGTPAGAVKPLPPGSASEVTRIFMNTLRTGSLPPEDSRYVGQLVAQQTGLPQKEAEKRVNDTYTRMQTALHDAENAVKEAADKSRKASAYTALWLFITLLIGAFIASFAATFGGRMRDA